MSAGNILSASGLASKHLYTIGLFDGGVTVLSQQTRSLNLAWALVEGEVIRTTIEASGSEPSKVAIVGGGFAGLTVAAGLLKKGVHASITVFEQRDTLLPLQQGSDSRWLHPRIYDWPASDSRSSSAMLPTLNWTAARASDVVVQVIAQWRELTKGAPNESIAVVCNARHLQVGEVDGKFEVEWIGERRQVDGSSDGDGVAATGRTDSFDVVILALGFGLERDNSLSYWRNDTFGQPSLEQPRRTFLVSGQGDGAMIDLLRLRISQFRQDRILGELFSDSQELLGQIAKLNSSSFEPGLFKRLEELSDDPQWREEFSALTKRLNDRLRRDTDAVLHLLVKNLAQLFEPTGPRISFQNKILMYLLYKCGGFIPSNLDEVELCREYGISADRIIRRHGTRRKANIRRVLSPKLYDEIVARSGTGTAGGEQGVGNAWPGGYFGYPVSTGGLLRLGDETKAAWRKEYLPEPTELIAKSFVSALSGQLGRRHRQDRRLRITLHRALLLGDDELLQQCCEYAGVAVADGGVAYTAARTFSVQKATIGLAYRSRKIIRSLKGVPAETLGEVMSKLELTDSRQMSNQVRFILAIPILEPESPGKFTEPAPVAGVIYVDSTCDEFYVEDEELAGIVAMANRLLETLLSQPPAASSRVRNVFLSDLAMHVPEPAGIPVGVERGLAFVDLVPPQSSGPFQFNFDYAEYIPIGMAAIGA